jgi:hypothetical protein
MTTNYDPKLLQYIFLLQYVFDGIKHRPISLCRWTGWGIPNSRAQTCVAVTYQSGLTNSAYRLVNPHQPQQTQRRRASNSGSGKDAGKAAFGG